VFNANAKTKGSDIATRAREAGVAAAKAAAASKAAQTAASAAQTAAQSAAQSMNIAAQSAAAQASKGVKQGVHSARGWAAPVLENAADYTTETIAPRVSAALRSTAQQVRPQDMRKNNNKVRSALTWSALGAAVLAALGAAAAVFKKRYQDATAADTEADAAEPTAPQADAAKAEADPPAAGTDTGVNGRVSTSGW